MALWRWKVDYRQCVTYSGPLLWRLQPLSYCGKNPVLPVRGRVDWHLNRCACGWSENNLHPCWESIPGLAHIQRFTDWTAKFRTRHHITQYFWRNLGLFSAQFFSVSFFPSCFPFVLFETSVLRVGANCDGCVMCLYVCLCVYNLYKCVLFQTAAICQPSINQLVFVTLVHIRIAVSSSQFLFHRFFLSQPKVK